MTAPLTVLLAEDDADLRDALEFALARQGYEVVTAADGDRANLSVLTAVPDLAVVEMMLPGSSGFTVAQLIKERSGGRVPVLMMSGNTTPAHRDYAYASGADLFLPKPFTFTALLDAVRSLDPTLPTPAATIPSRPARFAGAAFASV